MDVLTVTAATGESASAEDDPYPRKKYGNTADKIASAVTYLVPTHPTSREEIACDTCGK
jgi:hypothetical protein